MIVRTADNVLLKQHLQNLISKNVLSNEIVSDLEKAILMIDMEPVVRCKDCKHFDGCGACIKNGIMVWTDEWFCADGERK